MSKGAKVVGRLSMYVKANSAAPAPPLGPALGQRGVNIMAFCKDFNAKTAHIKKGVPLPTLIEFKSDRSFSFQLGLPPSSYFLKAAAGIEKGASKPGNETVAVLSVKHIYEIAKIKAEDPKFANTTLEGVCRCLIGSARSMGIKVVGQ